LVEIGSVVSEEKIFLNFIALFSIFSLAAILDGNRDHRTQFWKWAIQGSFQQSLVEIGSVVSEEKIFCKFHPPFFLPRWPPLLNIKISSNGQNCSSLSQKVPKFELYKHNDELLNIYYGIFMNLELLPILTDYAN
jgi:hypothetical protein